MNPTPANICCSLSKSPFSVWCACRGAWPPSRGGAGLASGRVDDPLQSFGVCYATDQVATAFAETVIYESSASHRGAWVVAEADLTSRWTVWFQRAARPQLLLADLTGTALKGLGLNNDLNGGKDYTLSQQ